MGDIVRDGAVMAISEFIIILLFLVLYGPAQDIITGLFLTAYSVGVTEAANYVTLIETVLILSFLLLGFVPVIWFVVRMMSREPDWGYRYY